MNAVLMLHPLQSKVREFGQSRCSKELFLDKSSNTKASDAATGLEFRVPAFLIEDSGPWG